MVAAEFDAIWAQLEDARKNEKLDADDMGKTDDELRDDYKDIAELTCPAWCFAFRSRTIEQYRGDARGDQPRDHAGGTARAGKSARDSGIFPK